MDFRKKTRMQIADMICGNYKEEESFFQYRSSSRLTEFFRDCDTDYVHDRSKRQDWVADTLEKILQEPQSGLNIPPDSFGGWSGRSWIRATQ